MAQQRRADAPPLPLRLNEQGRQRMAAERMEADHTPLLLIDEHLRSGQIARAHVIELGTPELSRNEIVRGNGGRQPDIQDGLRVDVVGTADHLSRLIGPSVPPARSRCGALPTQCLFEKGNRQLALGLQRGLVELVEQLEQGAHAARATGENEAADVVRQVQAAS